LLITLSYPHSDGLLGLTQSYPKTTPKTTPKVQTVENQALERFLWGFWVIAQKRTPSSPPPQPARRHDFCIQVSQHFYTFVVKPNKPKELTQTVENQGFDALG